ncbi:MAG: hypothetical protein ACC645_15205, partial [Pirellulales bacterium]
VWPSMAATAWGRFWGRCYENDFGFRLFGVPITVGRLCALISIPLILPVYFHMLIPRLPFIVFGALNSSCRRYRLTNRRIVVEHAMGGGEQRAVGLDRFDAIELIEQPGQAWYRSADLVFRKGPTETFRLAGVPSPQAFRQGCLNAQRSHVGVEQARQQGVAV